MVGGAVRDALLGRVPKELDLVVEGDAIPVARRAAERVNGVLLVHERFGTATVTADGFAFDLASARTETYPRPGALPEVKLGATIAQDLARRDFTVNAIAVSLADGELVEWPGAAGRPRGGSPARPARALVPRRPHADAAARPLRRAAAVQHPPGHAPADRPAADRHRHRRPARQRAASARLRAARRAAAARAHRPRRKAARPPLRAPSTTASAARSRSPPASRTSRARSSRSASTTSGSAPASATSSSPPRRPSNACTPTWTSPTPSCGGFCTASAPRPPSCSPPPATTAPSAGWTRSATASWRSPAPT